MTDSLQYRLREAALDLDGQWRLLLEAADRIDALLAERPNLPEGFPWDAGQRTIAVRKLRAAHEVYGDDIWTQLANWLEGIEDDNQDT